jgi:predicted Zn-dependent protease
LEIRNSMKIRLLLIIGIFLISSCTRNAITGRSQLSLLNESELQTMATQQYQQFLTSNKVVSHGSTRDVEMVTRVGQRLVKAINQYYGQKGLSAELNGYKWEYNLVDSKEVNAWCMPGGKIVVYTGLLPLCPNEASLAIVMGHEISHALAHHGNERMSQQLIAEGIGVAGGVLTSGNPKTSTIFNNVYGPSAQLGVLLPNSRRQELEADKLGLNFAAMAGYDPREAIPFWERMQKEGAGKKPPEFLSTHPSDETRIEKIKELMPEALKYYNPSGK